MDILLRSAASSLGVTYAVTQRDIPQTYRAGEIFSVAADEDHAEEIGPAEAEIVVGRKD